ncbi:MAG: hypothetical protein ACYSVY_24965 [Planctomycetota bacterium]|jgi:hypothetical protein
MTVVESLADALLVGVVASAIVLGVFTCQQNSTFMVDRVVPRTNAKKSFSVLLSVGGCGIGNLRRCIWNAQVGGSRVTASD